MHAKHADTNRLNVLSGRVIGCTFTVLNTLGAGFLERVYQTALAFELRATSLSVTQQFGASVYYQYVVVGECFVALLVKDALLLELKSANSTGRSDRCNAPITSMRPACGSVGCLISAGHVWRSSVWGTACGPLGPICVNLRASPSFICGRFLLTCCNVMSGVRVKRPTAGLEPNVHPPPMKSVGSGVAPG